MGLFSRSRRDIYYRLAKLYGYRARSAFKLLQIQHKFNDLFCIKNNPQENKTNSDNKQKNIIIDLCCAPGGWIQISSLFTSSDNTHILGIDLASVNGFSHKDNINNNITIMKADITAKETYTNINSYCESIPNSLVSLILCDGSPDIIGVSDIDEIIQHNLILSSLNLCIQFLAIGGSFVCKMFRGQYVHEMYCILNLFFDSVTITKPATCRNSSIEGFLVAEFFNPVTAFGVDYKTQFTSENPVSREILDNLNEKQLILTRKQVQFTHCLNQESDSDDKQNHDETIHCLDSDQTYQLNYAVNIQANYIYPSENTDNQHDASVSAAAVSSSSSSAVRDLNSILVKSNHESSPIDPPYKKSLQMKKQKLFATNSQQL